MRMTNIQPFAPALGVRGWLLLLALVTGLPMTVFSAVSLLEHIRAQMEKTDGQLRRYVLAAATDLDAKLSFKAAMLQALVATQNRPRVNVELLYEHAKGVETVLPDVQALSLVNRAGEQVFNTLEPYGAPLPRTGDMESVQRTFRDDRPTVSGLFTGTITSQPVTALGVPLRISRSPRYVLRMITPVEEYARLLGEQHLPEGWASTLFDANGVVLACTRNHEQHTGLPVSSVLFDVRDSNRVVEAVNQEGVKVRFAVASVKDWGWHVVVHVPVTTLYASMHVYLLRLVAIGVFCVICGFAGAWLLSRRFAAEVDLAARSCLLPEPGGPQAGRPTLVRELRLVGDELAAAREREEVALRDGLTGLAGRALFLRHARRLLASCRHDPAVRLAVLFIDLDGFKEVNDRYGHAEGDAVLRRTARVLEDVVRASDVLGRMGGDEFVLCLALRAETACEVVRGVAARVVSGVSQIGFGVGCSVGISLGPVGMPGVPKEDGADGGTGSFASSVSVDDGEDDDAPADLQTLLEQADKAMYAAKQAGKNSYHLLDMSVCG
jgi:diguanylate cyclase (GGDEF)-like protein